LASAIEDLKGYMVEKGIGEGVDLSALNDISL
jgi:hypothetical protein